MDAEMLYAEKHGIPAQDGTYDNDVYQEFYNKIRGKILKEHADAYSEIWRVSDLETKNAAKDAPAAAEDAPAATKPPAAAGKDGATDPELEQWIGGLT